MGVGVAFIVEVPESARKVQGAVDAVVRNEASCLLDAGVLSGQVGLVIKGKGNGFASAAQHSSGVPDIGHVETIFGHEQHHRRRANLAANPVLRLPFAILSVKFLQLLLPSVRGEEVVDAREEIDQSARVVPEFIVRLVEQFLREVLCRILGDLWPSVAVEDCEEMDAGLDLGVELHIFHGPAPALHFAADQHKPFPLDLLYLSAEQRLFEIVGFH
jgi:hypothetical protein